MIIRRETPADRPEILALTREAFPEPAEARLLQALFASREYLPELSLVAQMRGGEILGHVITTRARLGGQPALGLGPLAVLPPYQRQGVGSALMEASIAVAEGLGESVIVLLGSSDYYPRFGFVPADSLGILSPDPSWGSHFMARPLAAFHGGLRGPFHYAPAFTTL